jgi:SHS2 domain-containing protein
MTDSERGRRAVPHPADVRIEAWGPTREACIAEAVLGAVETFLDVSAAHPTTERSCELSDESDEDLLVAVLEEVIYLLDTANAVPVDVEVEPVDGGVDVRFAMVDAVSLPQVGAVPKAVSWHDLRLARGDQGWWCSVTLDV